MSFVYFIACEPLEAVKIGYTRSNPYARLAALQTGCPSPLKMLAYLPATIDEERRLHEAFEPLHIQGEWFRHEWKLSDFIGYLDHGRDGPATRQEFENALHDVLMQGCWHPDSEITEDQYLSTGRWAPFHELLWKVFGPWEDA